jgi:polyisoprenoid-binding protein YceI
MPKFILSILLISSFATMALANEVPLTELKVIPAESKVQWTARKVTGKHTGMVNVRDGVVHITDGMLTKAHISIDMTSIIVTDLSGNSKTKLEGHLKSDDFFGVDKYPTAVLMTTSVTALSDEDYRITADLTIRGITHPITFDAHLIPNGKKYIANANLVIDRSLYEVKYRSGKFFDDLGDATIYDEFDLAIALTIE